MSVLAHLIPAVSAQNATTKKPSQRHGDGKLAYYGVFLGELRNATYGIESGRAYLVNESHIQVVGLTTKGSSMSVPRVPLAWYRISTLAAHDMKLRFSFSTATEIGKAEDVYEVIKDANGEEYLVAR